MKHTFSYKGCAITATEYYRASVMADTAFYFHGSDEVGQHLASAARQRGLNVILIGIDGEDWNRDLSPWPAPKVFRSEADFSGGADAYLSFLCEILIPQVERDFICIRQRSLIGYSLAGLFAVYSLYRTELFQAAASVSGSLWYDGFTEFAMANAPKAKPQAVYLSLGDKERYTRNARMSQVEQCTVKMEHIMAEGGVNTIFELNPGNHFADVNIRMEKALVWLKTK